MTHSGAITRWTETVADVLDRKSYEGTVFDLLPVCVPNDHCLLVRGVWPPGFGGGAALLVESSASISLPRRATMAGRATTSPEVRKFTMHARSSISSMRALEQHLATLLELVSPTSVQVD